MTVWLHIVGSCDDGDSREVEAVYSTEELALAAVEKSLSCFPEKQRDFERKYRQEVVSFDVMTSLEDKT